MPEMARDVAIMLPDGRIHRAFEAHRAPDLGQCLLSLARAEKRPGEGVDDIGLVRCEGVGPREELLSGNEIRDELRLLQII